MKQIIIRKAIMTKVLFVTATKPTRVKAYDGDGNNYILSMTDIPYRATSYEAARIAAETLKRKMQWSGALVGGWTGTASHVFVFLD